MAYKVYLSPSNQPRNMCALGHSEKQHCEELVQRMLPLLLERGIEFKVRQASNSMSANVNEATAWGAQLYVPIHTNATASGSARGTRFGYYPGRNDSMEACKAFKQNWIKIYPYPDKVRVGTYTFYEAKAPKCPSVYCETVFHDNKQDAQWFHDNLDRIALNFVESIAGLLGVKDPESPIEGQIIKMQIKTAENAEFFNKPLGSVVSLPVEEYLMGVVPAEVGNSHIEACVAQAIASRSILLSGRWGDTITDTTSHQAYNGSRSVDPDFFRAHQAVKDSKGVVLLYNGKIASCFYADSNGGKMVASDMHWNQKIPYEQREHIPYLVTKDDPWTLASGKPFNGHPVGMSQQGAIWAANNGIKHDEILAFYYPGTVLSAKVIVSQPEPKPEPNPEPKPNQPPTPFPSPDALYVAEVVTRLPKSLNIWRAARKGISLKLIPRGALVEVLQEVNKTWAKVRYSGVVGYCDRQYLKREYTSDDVLYNAVVKTRFPLSLNIWREARKGISLGRIPRGATVGVLKEVDGTWAKIRYRNIVGFSDRQYLDIK